jgi:Tfp pilus assembly protein PilF
MHIDENNFQTAIDIIQDVLLLTTSRVQTSVTYLRLRLPENHLQMREKWEQRPANVLESSYINLAYAILRLRSSREALELLGKEALVLLPNSIRLKHAIARYYLHDKRADLADSIYDELSRKSIGDLGLENEIRLYSSKTRRGGKKHSSRTRRGKGR